MMPIQYGMSFLSVFIAITEVLFMVVTQKLPSPLQKPIQIQDIYFSLNHLLFHSEAKIFYSKSHTPRIFPQDRADSNTEGMRFCNFDE